MRKSIWMSILVFLCVLALLLTMLWPSSTTGESTAGAASATADSPQQVAEVLEPCPVTTLGGVTLDCLGANATGDMPTQRTVVNIWAWWCEPCREELPLFDELAVNHPEITVIGVQADRDETRGVALLQDLGITMPSLSDVNNTFAPALGLPGVVPITVVFDENGEMEDFYAVPFSSYEQLESTVL